MLSLPLPGSFDPSGCSFRSPFPRTTARRASASAALSASARLVLANRGVYSCGRPREYSFHSFLLMAKTKLTAPRSTGAKVPNRQPAIVTTLQSTSDSRHGLMLQRSSQNDIYKVSRSRESSLLFNYHIWPMRGKQRDDITEESFHELIGHQIADYQSGSLDSYYTLADMVRLDLKASVQDQSQYPSFRSDEWNIEGIYLDRKNGLNFGFDETTKLPHYILLYSLNIDVGKNLCLRRRSLLEPEARLSTLLHCAVILYCKVS